MSSCPIRVMLLFNQGHACRMYGAKKEGLERGKLVRIASRILCAKLIELYFRLNDRGVVLALIFAEVK